jgi:hypothetical protein
MALSATTVFDIVDQTQSITFNNPTMVDQISFANNQLTFAEISTFTLTQSDMLLYVKYLQALQEFLWTIPMMNQFGNQIAIY